MLFLLNERVRVGCLTAHWLQESDQLRLTVGPFRTQDHLKLEFIRGVLGDAGIIALKMLGQPGLHVIANSYVHALLVRIEYVHAGSGRNVVFNGKGIESEPVLVILHRCRSLDVRANFNSERANLTSSGGLRKFTPGVAAATGLAGRLRRISGARL
jgi:hypothetical protein